MNNEQQPKRKKKRRGERADGRIQVTAQVGVNPDTGKPIRKSFYGKTRTEAERKRDEYLGLSKKGIDVSRSNIFVNQWVDEWIQMYDIDTTEYKAYIDRLRKSIGGMRIKDVTEGMLVQLMNSIKGKSRSCASKQKTIIKQCFHKAYKNRIIQDDPSQDITIPDETTSGTHRTLERWEIEAILNNWRIHPAGKWAMLMLFCGLRRGEMIALQWDCIDMKQRTLTVKRSASRSGSQFAILDKTKTPAGMRTIPVCDELYFMLCETPESEREGFVCKTATGYPITNQSVWDNWDIYCKAMTCVLNGINPSKTVLRNLSNTNTLTINNAQIQPFKCRMHDLRHTFATMLYNAGVDMKSAQYYLGHADSHITIDLYTHLTEEQKSKSGLKLTKYLDGYAQPPID